MKKLQKIFNMVNYTRFLITLLFVLATLSIFSSIYTVKEGEVGVLRTFGKVTAFTKPGIHLKFPYPIQEVDVINTNRPNIIEIGIKDKGTRYKDLLNNEYESLTMDNGIVLTNLIVEWKIIDPYSYLFNVSNPEHVLKNVIISSLKSNIAKTTMEDLLSNEKIEIANSIKNNIEKNLSFYGLGIDIISVKILDIRPPKDTLPAFESVANAIEQKNSLLNNAKNYENEVILAAQGKANEILKKAETYYQERINRAKSEAEIFDALYKEYKLSKEVTKTRIFIETLEEILPSAIIYIMNTKEGNTLDNIFLYKDNQN